MTAAYGFDFTQLIAYLYMPEKTLQVYRVKQRYCICVLLFLNS